MKTKLLFKWMFLISIAANAQVYQSTKNLNLARINENTRAILSSSTIVGTLSESSSVISNEKITKGTLFEKVNEIGDYYILEILPFSNNNIENKRLYNSDYDVNSSYSANLFYIVSKNQIVTDFEENKSRLGFGTVLLPVKIRFGDERDGTKLYTKFESGINLGVALTWRFNRKLKDVDRYGLFSLSTSQINLDPENTNNYISSSQSALALTPSAGLLFQFRNKLQIILITGIDVVSGKIGREWIYRDKPFLGVGLGFNIAELGKKPNANDD